MSEQISVTYQPASTDMAVAVQLPAGSTVGHLLAHRSVNTSATGLVFLVNGSRVGLEQTLSEGDRIVSMKSKVAGALGSIYGGMKRLVNRVFG